MTVPSLLRCSLHMECAVCVPNVCVEFTYLCGLAILYQPLHDTRTSLFLSFLFVSFSHLFALSGLSSPSFRHPSHNYFLCFHCLHKKECFFNVFEALALSSASTCNVFLL